ncbi:MAG TPA: TIGR04282 family arsenosugar biosynthesis glycosyltransferase [Beijerinckiaceae bacterium]|jgi:rSAM/selenodomain-associated transferase 1
MSEIAVFAKAPVPGYAKTRLIPRLGAEGAAKLQARLIDHTLRTAAAAGLGPVTLWGAPDTDDPLLKAAALRTGARLVPQPEGDLGARMLAAFAAAEGPLVLIGTDSPCLTPRDLRDAAAALATGADAVIAPAEDGGYALIAAARLWPTFFADMPWSTAEVAEETRRRARKAGLTLVSLRTVWDVDTPADHARLEREGLLG